MEPGAVIRSRRGELALRQGDLAGRLGVTQPFVSQMERGVVTLPNEAVRAALERELGVDPFTARAEERAGRLSLTQAAGLLRARGLRVTVQALMRLTAESKVRARYLGDGRGYEVDERELLEDIDRLPPCRYNGCEAPATSETGCCPEHGQAQWAIEARGKKRPPEVCANVSAGMIGTPRPDAARRMHARHKLVRAAVDRAKNEDGLLAVSDVARGWGTTPRAVISHYVYRGLLRPKVTRVLGQPRLLFDADEVASFPYAPRGERGRRAWKVGDGFAAVWIALRASDPVWNRYRKRWCGTETLLRARDPSAKGRAQALELGEEAIRLVQKFPNGKSPDRRRLILEALMLKSEGPVAIDSVDGTPRARDDAVYRAARARIVRKIQRAYREMGQPAELETLL